jgi:ribose transport system permease protein
MTTLRRPSAALTQFVVASRYMPVYAALALLVVVASIWAPAAIGGSALRSIALYGSILGIAALGQMLVIMTGGIDLSTPGTFSLAAVIMVGVGNREGGSLSSAILTAVGVAALIGLVNGVLIGGLKLNALIVTLAVGQAVAGIVNRYGRTFPVQRPVPASLSEWASSRILGFSPIFWMGLAITVLFILAFRYTAVGRRFQVVGANPVAAHVVGVRVSLNQVSAYVVAAVLYAIAGVALAGTIVTPGVASGGQYLLAPIAAVVIGGASLTGGLASSFSTFAAAMFLTGLNRMMLIMGLSTAWQYTVFGVVIIVGMLVSGDRIIKTVERVLRERRPRAPEPSTAVHG